MHRDLFQGQTDRGLFMDKLQPTRQNLCRVFNFRSGHLHAATFLVLPVKLPNLQLKTRLKQLIGYLPLDSPLPILLAQPSCGTNKKNDPWSVENEI